MIESPFLEPILFASRQPLLSRAIKAGIRSFIVDWEWRNKEQRQSSADTEINRDSPEDLARLATLGVESRLCRLNHLGDWTAEEIEVALEAGASDLLLPMVESPEQVDRFLSLVRSRARAGILIETVQALEAADEIASLPVDWVYVGFNDLAISRGSKNLFVPLIDGTMERLASVFRGRRFGFAGLTVADGGHPIPCCLLMGEMVRLGAAFTFLRRSFRRDVAHRDIGAALNGMRQLWSELARRSPLEVAANRSALRAAIDRVA